MKATKIQEPGLLAKILCSASKFPQVRDLSQVLFGQHRAEATIPDVLSTEGKAREKLFAASCLLFRAE